MIAEVLFYHFFQIIAFGLTVYYRDSSWVTHTIFYLRQAVYLCFMIAFKSYHAAHYQPYE